MTFLRRPRACNRCLHFNEESSQCNLQCQLGTYEKPNQGMIWFPNVLDECEARRRYFTSKQLDIRMISVADQKRAIGNKQELLFHLPSELQHFKKQTSGGILVMGRKTFESLPKRLPGREHWVLSKNEFAGNILESAPGVHWFSDLHSLFEHAGISANGRTLWIIGGGEIYRQLMPYAKEILLTEVQTKAEHADTMFPQIPPTFVEDTCTDLIQKQCDPYPYIIRRFVS